MTGPAQPASRTEAVDLRLVSWRLELPFLRELRCGGVELLRAVYVAVRDRNWGTVAAEVTVQESRASSSGFDLRFSCRHDNGDVGFDWEGRILGAVDAHGARLSYSMEGRATRAFKGNRVGFCLLHPAEVAGAAVRLRTSAGQVNSAFPAEISPWQPFSDLLGMSYSVQGASADITLEGDTFETEDQRNWTDASFKTYCTPLSLGFPRDWQEGGTVRQRVTVDFAYPAASPRDRRRSTQPVVVRLGDVASASLPGIGLAAPQDDGSARVAEAAVDALGQLKLHHLHVVVDPTRTGWEGRLGQDLAIAGRLRAPVQWEVVVDEVQQLEPVAAAVLSAKEAAGQTGPVMLFDRASSVSTRALVSAWWSLSGTPELAPPVYVGSRANFTELNRAEIAFTGLQGVTFAVNPQVHAFSNEEIVQTLEVHGTTARQAIAMTGGIPLHVGPITLLPRFNAVATEASTWGPPPADPRQPTLFTAAWALGSIASLAQAGAATLTYFETAGPGGVLDIGPGGHRRFPVYELLRSLAGRAGARVVAASTSPDDAPAAVLCLRSAGGWDLYIGNLSAVEVTVRVEADGARWVATLIDAAAVQRLLAGKQPATELREGPQVKLGPYEVAVLRALVSP